MSTWPWQSSTAAKPCGTCWRCGGTIYEHLVHHCTTAVRISPRPFQWTVKP